MSYEKQTWSNGDVITAGKLNHIEDGLGGASPIVYNATYDSQSMALTIGTTFGAIRTAFESGIPVFIKYDDMGTTRTKAVQQVNYVFYSDSVNGEIIVDMNTSVGAYVGEAPFTLEALDAQPV